MPLNKKEEGILQKVYAKQEGMSVQLGVLTEKVGQQNHRIDTIESQNEREQGAKEEREKWEHIERDRMEKKDSNQWKLLGIGIGGAGVLSATVIGVIEVLSLVL